VPRGERHELRHEIDQLEQTWRDAVMKKDVTAMDSLLADDTLPLLPAEPSVERTGAHHSSRGALNFSSIEFSDRKVRFTITRRWDLPRRGERLDR
jgi:hypothetical protein